MLAAPSLRKTVEVGASTATLFKEKCEKLVLKSSCKRNYPRSALIRTSCVEPG